MADNWSAEVADEGEAAGDAVDEALGAELEATGVEPGEWFTPGDGESAIAPGNLDADYSPTTPGWGEIFHGQTEVGGELKDVSFNMKLNPEGEVTDYLVSPGHNTREFHDQRDPYQHGHAGGQNTDHPWHDDRGQGVFDADSGVTSASAEGVSAAEDPPSGDESESA